MTETKLPVNVIQYLLSNNRLFDAISTGLTILNFNILGDVKILSVTEIDVKSRGKGDPAVVIEFEVDGDKKLQMIDSQFLQSLVVKKEHFAEMMEKVDHEHSFGVKGGKTEEFKNLFFFEDVDEKGLRNADFIQPVHKVLGLGEETNSAPDLGSMSLKLVGIMVNKRRDDDVALFDHDFPRAKAGSYPSYRDLRTKWEDAGNEGIYTIGMYADDYHSTNGKNPNIQGVVNVPRNWSFTPIFVNEDGKLFENK